MSKKKLTVTHLITTIERGGAEMQLLILCREQIKLGMTVEVVFLKGSPELINHLSRLGVSVRRLGGNSLLFQVIIFSWLMWKNNTDLVHAHLPQAELVASLGFHIKPIIISRHNSEPFYPRAWRKVSQILSNFCIFRAAKVIAISNSVKLFMLRNCESLQKEKVVVVHYGYEFKSDSEEIGSELYKDGQRESLKILSIGRLVPQKDFPTLLRAIAIAISLGVKPVVKIVGDGPLRNELKQMVEHFGIGETISFLPKTSEIDQLYREADLFILASTYEGFGMVLLEAISWGTPIICSKTTAAIEVLGNDYMGFFEVGNAGDLAQQISSFSVSRPRLVSEAQARRSLFTAKKMAVKITSIYDTVTC